MAALLIVDDDDGVRDLVAMILKTNGYSVLTASNGLEALMIYSSYRTVIDLVLTDIDMPEMDGIELVARIRANDRNERAILMSGRPPDRRTLPDNCQFLKKPFLPKQLIDAVQKVIEKAEADPSRVQGTHPNGC
jgi:two-component system cell cycle sensor histidine kinase/response regulator CckA